MPGAWGGVVTVRVVGLTTVTAVPAAPPKVTPTPAWKSEPRTVTRRPPAVDPELGSTELTPKAANRQTPTLLCRMEVSTSSTVRGWKTGLALQPDGAMWQ